MFFRIFPLPLGTNAVHKQNWYRLSTQKLQFKTVQIIYGQPIGLMQEEHLVWVTELNKNRSFICMNFTSQVVEKATNSLPI